MFHFLKGKNKENVLYAPCKGKVVPLSEVPDPTFSEKILGDGFAVIPSEGKIYAPTDGEIAMVFDTLHAITLTSSSGTEILIHIGLDTVTLKGAPFTAHVAAGDLNRSPSSRQLKKYKFFLPVEIYLLAVFMQLASKFRVFPLVLKFRDSFASVYCCSNLYNLRSFLREYLYQ